MDFRLRDALQRLFGVGASEGGLLSGLLELCADRRNTEGFAEICVEAGNEAIIAWNVASLGPQRGGLAFWEGKVRFCEAAVLAEVQKLLLRVGSGNALQRAGAGGSSLSFSKHTVEREHSRDRARTRALATARARTAWQS